MSPTPLLAAVLVRGIVLFPDSGGRGQLCPISPDIAYTAAHVMGGSISGQWVSPTGGGQLTLISNDPKTDVAIGRSDKPFPFWYPRAKEPQVGQALWVSGWNVWAKDWYVSPGLYYGLDAEDEIAMSTPIHFGMSGGCILTEQEEAVGIVRGFLENHNGPYAVSYGKPLWRMAKKSKEVK